MKKHQPRPTSDLAVVYDYMKWLLRVRAGVFRLQLVQFPSSSIIFYPLKVKLLYNCQKNFALSTMTYDSTLFPHQHQHSRFISSWKHFQNDIFLIFHFFPYSFLTTLDILDILLHIDLIILLQTTYWTWTVMYVSI